MVPEISVVICTHNPRLPYLERVLSALERQTLLRSKWELILVDNCSDKPLSQIIDLTWHGNARHVREEELGLTPARLRGIQEAVGETLIFVDDDNILDSDYLEIALQISKEWPMLGVWGGQVRPEFEATPPDWTKPHWGALAIKEFDRDMWSNTLNILPVGAGMCIRQSVARRYAQLVQEKPIRVGLDRKGKDDKTDLITSGGDLDLAMTSSELNLGTGLFAKMKLTHIIPRNRLEESYLIKWTEGNAYSCAILNSLRGEDVGSLKLSLSRKAIDILKMCWMPLRERKFYRAWRRGQALAVKKMLSE